MTIMFIICVGGEGANFDSLKLIMQCSSEIGADVEN